MATVKGTTASGFKYSVDPNIMKSYRFLKLYTESIKDPNVGLQLIEKVLGSDQEEKLIKHVEKKVGFDDTETIIAEFTEIIQKLTDEDKALKAQRKAEKAAAKEKQKAEKAAAKEQRKAEKAAAKEQRKAEKAAAKQLKEQQKAEAKRKKQEAESAKE